jgi:hypothetical protein
MRVLLAVLLAAVSLSQEQSAIHQHLADHAIIQERSTNWLLIPAAGSLQGAAGTFFRSDVMISNHRSTPQVVDLSFCAQNVSCSTSGFQLMQITVPGNSQVFYADIVRQLGKQGSLGTLDIRARTSMSDGTLDAAAKIDAFSRIWTLEAYSSGTPLEGGTTSQSFPSVKIDAVHGSARAYILGLQQDLKYRTNIGIYNDDPTSAHTFTVRLLSADGQTTSFTITVQPWSMNQVPVPVGISGNVMAVITPDSSIGIANWAAYGSSTDNITGDGWVSIGSQNE